MTDHLDTLEAMRERHKAVGETSVECQMDAGFWRELMALDAAIAAMERLARVRDILVRHDRTQYPHYKDECAAAAVLALLDREE